MHLREAFWRGRCLSGGWRDEEGQPRPHQVSMKSPAKGDVAGRTAGARTLGSRKGRGAQGNGGCSAWGVQCRERRREAGRTVPGGDEGAAQSLATAAEEANHTTPEGKGCTTAARPRGPNSAPGTPGSPRGGAGRGGLHGGPGSRPCQSFGQRSVTTAQCCWKQSPARSENHWSSPIPLFHI